MISLLFTAMKHFFIIFLLSVLFLAACSNFNESINSSEDNYFNVSFSEISSIDFSSMLSPRTKAENPLSKTITPIVEDADTLLYVINYGNEDGWVLASGDKRAPLVMAYSDEGRFDINETRNNPGLTEWITRVRRGLTYLKKHPDFLPDTTNLSNWNKQKILSTKGGSEHEGEWLQLVYTIITSELHYDIDHFMITRWAQGNPWNLSMPLASSSTRCVTGSGAVAAAQVAYYLNDFIGKPISAYSFATCSDYYNDNPITIDFYGLSGAAWSYMITYSGQSDSNDFGKRAVSALIADAAEEANTVYTPTSSSSYLAHYSSFFSKYNINCTYSMTFDSDIVDDEVINGLPVIIGLVKADNSGGHIAVIDGAQIYSFCQTQYYQWMPIGTYPPVEPVYPDLDHPELYVISNPIWTSTNTDRYYRINWGDGYNDNTLYQCSWGFNWNGYNLIDEMMYAFD